MTYSNELYEKTRDYSAKMALKKGGFDRVIIYTPEDMDEEFRKINSRILSIRRGNGLWLWKPYFMLRALNSVGDNDIVFYCDAASFFFSRADDVINSMGEEDVWVSDLPLIEKQFTKEELFVRLGCHEEWFYNSNQIQASFLAIRKTEKGMRFAKEWLKLCCEIDNILPDTDESNYIDKDYNYIDHRFDQSILSLLSKKWSIIPHQDPSQYGRIPELYYSKNYLFSYQKNLGEYKPCIILHRNNVIIRKKVIWMWMMTWIPKWIVYKRSPWCYGAMTKEK